MVTIRPRNYGSGSSIEVNAGVRVYEITLKLTLNDKTVAFSLDPAECEAVENALRIQRREAERRRK